MIAEEQAAAIILERIALGPAERVPLEEAFGRYLRGALLSRIAVPGFHSTSVDGFALPPGNHAAGSSFRLIGEQPAGRDRGLTVGSEETVRVFTGAPLPQGAASIAMQEDARLTKDEAGVVTMVLAADVAEGENLRRRGEDLCEGQRILAAGARLSPQRLGLLASQGWAEVEVTARPRVAILCTGDELVPPGQPLAPGQIHESNGAMLRALAVGAGADVSVTHAPDDPERMRQVISSAKDEADIMLISGGVSVGKHDLVKPALRDLGLEALFWRVDIKPGKPLLFGALDSCLVFGLPGNPVSSFVSFHLFVAPALRKWQGADAGDWPPPTLPAKLAIDLANSDARPHYVRGWRDADGMFRPTGLQKSHGLFGLSQANALARVPGAGRWEAGAMIDVVSVG